MANSEDEFVVNDNGHCRLCTKPDAYQDMVACDNCDRWFHYGCAGLDKLPSKQEPWDCVRCSRIFNEKEALRKQIEKLTKFMDEQALEIEARARKQKNAELEANSLKEEFEHYKEKISKKGTKDQSSEDPIVTLANIMSKAIKTENKQPNEEKDQALSIYLQRQEMNLPSFHGNAKDWASFKKMFDYTTIAGKYTNLENLMRLQKALGGQAAKSVQSLLMDPNNIPQILERLEKQFGQPKKIYKELRDDIERIRSGGHSTLIEVSTALESLVTHLSGTQNEDYLNDPRLIEDIMSKLSYDIQIKWLEEVKNSPDHKNLGSLYEWLKPKADIQRELHPQRTYGVTRNRVNLHQEKIYKCWMCNGTHRMNSCKQFLELTPQRRWDEIKKKQLCYCCFGKHESPCRFNKRCGIDGCNRTHNKLLHNKYVTKAKSEPENMNTSQEDQPEEKPSTSVERTNLHQEQRAKVYYQIMPVSLRNGKNIVKTYAFLDPGSSLTLLEEGVAEELELEGINDPLKIRWTQNVSREEKTSQRVTLKISGSSNVEYTLADVRTAADLHLPRQTVNYKQLQEEYSFLRHIPIESFEEAQPRILIGLNHSHLLYPIERRSMGINHPIAIKTKLGWLIFGNIKVSPQEEFSLKIKEEQDEKMQQMMQSFFALENLGVKIPEAMPEGKQDKRVNELVKNSLIHNGERYQIKLLWKKDEFALPNSYQQAYKRLINQENKLKKDDELKQWMRNVIQDYINKGYARKLTQAEAVEWADESFYLPHFIVINKNKTPRKPRLVFDAAAKSNGVSLNSMLLAGPDATTSLLGITARFREGEFATAGDIQEMFSQVKVPVEDQKRQSFLFRDFDESKEPDVYVMQVMIFGATCSPACAQIVKNHNASLFEDTMPKAAGAIVKQHYVDDYIDSFDTTTEAIETIKDVIKIHNHAGFYIRNFVSNNKAILASLPKERIQESKIKLFEDKESNNEKILGVYWNLESDNIQFQVKFERLPSDVLKNVRRPSKREILSFVMSIYDPMGLVSHLTIHGKILMQELHKETSDWDEEIPEHLYGQWLKWLEFIQQATRIKIPRWIRNRAAQSLELHTFVDASEYAFAAIIYVRGINEEGDTASLRLLAAKARVAPIKKLSIPRLELQAALLGTRLTKSIHSELRLKIQKNYYWSDSQTVLSWIHSDHRKYNQFIAHRVGEILEETKMDQWRYVPTDKNPADEGTKHVTKKSQWLSGPEFLWQKEFEWPQSKFMRNTEEELKNQLMIHVENPDLEFIQEYRYSDWSRLVSHVCTLKKFGDWIQNKKEFKKYITYEDKLAAERAIIRKAQWEEFPKEIQNLKRSSFLTIKSDLGPLYPTLNEYDVVVSRSRLEYAPALPLAMKEPMILPSKHYVTKLIVKMYHERYFHQMDNVVLGAIYQKYYPIRARTMLNTVKKHCQYCKLQDAKPEAPPMSPLTKGRLDIYAAPFTHTGVDYFGPLEVIVRRTPEKRWGVIFTCMTTRAVYIELAEKLDTDSFILCLRNFQNRRGKISYLYSDNGTNFVGAEKEMRLAIQKINDKMGRSVAAAMNIQWYFNPPAAPHFGGAWERLIQTIKNCVYEMLKARGHHKPSVEILRSALIQAEFILNSRPLTHVPIDNPHEDPLTPFHFLIHRAGEYVPPMVIGDCDDKKAPVKVDQYERHFWDKFKKQYLPTLIKRTKWTNQVTPLEVGDIVLVEGKDPPKGQYQGKWLKGRIVEVRGGNDGHNRSAIVKTMQGLIDRPVIKLAKLDVKNDPEKTEYKRKANLELSQKEGKPIQVKKNVLNETKKKIDKPDKNQEDVSKARLIRLEALRKRKNNKPENKSETHYINHHREEIEITPVNISQEKVSDLGMFRKAEINFSQWGKRRKVDIEKVKELRDRLNSQKTVKTAKTTKKINAPWYATMMLILYLVLTAFGNQPSGLIAYDCANPEVNMTSYSLLDVTSCLPTAKNVSVTEVPIQVLQRSSKSSTSVYQCKMIIRRSIRHCGMHSHTSDYERSYDYTVKSFTPEECKRVQLTGTVPLTMNAGLNQLKRNFTTRGQTLVTGSVWSSSCSGGVYKTPEYTWINALVYFQYEISLYNYIATVDHENDQIHLRHGLICPYSHGQCLDSEDGYSTWDVSMNQRCEETEFEVIYEGKVNKTINLEENKTAKHAVYTSISDSHLFSIRTRDVAKICGYKGYSTDHPRIFILEDGEIRSPFTRKPSGVRNHDIFTYFNSKITLVENYVGQKLDEVYNSVMTEMCKLDKNLLETKLTLARMNPTEFVTSIMRRTGFSAVVAGEVLHVLECKPVYVQPVATEKCYQELPVKYGNITMFLTPVTRTLQPRGTEIECTPLLPAKFQFGGRWYTFDGKIRESIPPQKLATDIVTKWTYTPLPNLMESGVYDAESIKKMRIMIYEQGDKRVASNIVHRILSGQTPSRQGFHFEALMSEKLIDNMINKYWQKLVSWSTWLGSITSTAIGLYMIGRIIKFVVDTLMHGKILYDIYGFGWQLIASFWDTMTSFLTHRNTLRKMKIPRNEEDQNNETLESAPLPDERPQPVVRGPPVYPHIMIPLNR